MGATLMHTGGGWPSAAVINGEVHPIMLHFDMSLSHCTKVDQDGRRFCNESASYQAIGKKLYERHLATGRGIPALIILEQSHRQR